MLLTLIATALAALPIQQDDLSRWWTSTGRLYIGETAYHIGDTPLTLSVAPCSVSLDSGILVPVYAESPAPQPDRIVGLAWMGEGDGALRFSRRGELLSLANHLDLGRSEADALLAGAPLELGADRALILSSDAHIRDLFAGLLPVRSGVMIGDGEGEADETYVVTGTRGRLKAALVSTNLLPDRLHQLEKAGVFMEDLLRLDRLSGGGTVTLLDVRTDRDWGVAAMQDPLTPDRYDRWMTCLRDESDILQAGRAVAFAHGTDLDDRHHLMTLASAPLPRPAGFLPQSAEVDVEVIPRRRGIEQEGAVTATVTLQATGGSRQHVVLDMPVGEALLSTFQLSAVTTEDGTPVAWVGLSAKDDVQAAANEHTAMIAETMERGTAAGITDDGMRESLAVTVTPYRYPVLAVLPEPVADGERVTLRLTWTARWLFGRYSDVTIAAPDGSELNVHRSMGATTGSQPLLPQLLPRLDAGTWDFTATLRTVQPLLVTREAVLSGQTLTRRMDEDTLILTAAGQGTPGPMFAVGRWLTHAEPAAMGMPAVHAAVFASQRDALAAVPPEVRRVVSFLEDRLPDYPLGELAVFQDGSTLPVHTAQWSELRAEPGIVALKTARPATIISASYASSRNPYAARIQLASQVAGQYWGQQIVAEGPADAWMMDALTGAYAASYLRAAVGVEAYQEHVEAMRKRVERPDEVVTHWMRTDTGRPLSLTTPPALSRVPASVRADFGTYLLVGMLRPRLTDPVFFAALSDLAARSAGQTITTADLQTAFELAAGRDLSAFFEYWVDGGLLPSLSLTWIREDDAVHGCLRSDIPLGEIDVMVEVEDGDGVVMAMVPVVDGVGRFALPDPQGAVSVRLDPEALTLARQRSVRRDRDALQCR